MPTDLRYVVRKLVSSWSFTLVAVLSLAIGIGANSAMFGVIRTLLVTPMPVEAPTELAVLAWRTEESVPISQLGSTDYADEDSGLSYRSNFSHPLYQALRSAAPEGVDLFAFAFLRGVSVAVGDQPAFLAGGLLADGHYMPTLGVRTVVGRALAPEDDRPDAPLTAVLGYSFWMRAFGGDHGIVGRTVRINGNTAEIVGVTAEGFRGMSMGGFFPQTDITVPLSAQERVYSRLASEPLFTSDDHFWLRVMARIQAGASEVAATQALEAALRSHPSPLIDDGGTPDLRLFPGAQGAQPVREGTARLLRFLLGVVGLVLVIACVNLATLMLARGANRQRELAVRRALGGTRSRVVRLILLESFLLAGLGTATGLAFAWSTRLLLTELLTGSLGSGAFGALEMEVAMDPVVVAGSALLGIGATVLFGLIPALRLSDVSPVDWLRYRPGAGESSPRLGLGRLLIALQIAVSVPLLVGAALFLRTISNLGAVQLGFDPTGVVAFQVDPGYTQLEPEEYATLYQELLSRIETVEGVRSATLMENALLSGIQSNGTITVDGERHLLHHNAIGPALLETIGMRLLEGRMPGLQDGPGAPRVGVINETGVRELFGGGAAVGRTLDAGGGRPVEIIGVVNDTPYRNRRDPIPSTLYESAFQRLGYGGHHLVLRIDAPVARVEPRIREAVAGVDADLPVPEIRTQTEIMEQTNAKERAFTQLLTIFGVFALLLASIGLHGVTSYSVTRRTGEIGVRVALGARPSQIAQLVLRQVLVLSALGLLVGVPLSLAVGPVVASLLFGVPPTDPMSIAAAAAVMIGVSVMAGLLPALRAAGLEAQVALRTE